MVLDKSIFKIYVNVLEIKYLKPWERKSNMYTGTCSVFQISGKNYYLTCYHVVRDAISIEIAGIDEKLLFHSVAFDLAILSCSQEDVIPLDFGQAKTGDEIQIAGFPLMFRGLASTRGTLTRLTKIRIPFGKFLVFQTDAVTNSGNSGGPVLNAKNEIVGVIFSVYLDYQNTNNICPFFTVKYFIDLFKEKKGMYYMMPAFNWQIVDDYMPFKEKLIINGKIHVSSIENIPILENGQIRLKDFLTHYGFAAEGEELISFQYIIPYLKKALVLLDKHSAPLVKKTFEYSEPVEYLTFGDFVFTPLSRSAYIQAVQAPALSPINTFPFPKSGYYVFISFSKHSKYRYLILNVLWEDFKKELKTIKKTRTFNVLNDSWKLYLNESDRGNKFSEILFEDTK